MAGWRFFNFSEHGINYIREELSLSFSFDTFSILRINGLFRLKILLISSFFLLHVRVYFHLSVRSLLIHLALVCLHILRSHIVILSIHVALANLSCVATWWYTRRFKVSRVFLNVHDTGAVHAKLVLHRDTTSSWRDLLHPLLSVTIHLSVVIYHSWCWQDWQLDSVDCSTVWLRLFTIFLLNRLIIFHFTFKVSEIFPIFLLGLLDFLSQNDIGTITLFQAFFDLLDQVDFLKLHFSYLVVQGLSLSLVTI